MFVFNASSLFLCHSLRLVLTFDAVDSTHCINPTTFNYDVAKLFAKTIDALYANYDCCAQLLNTLHAMHLNFCSRIMDA